MKTAIVLALTLTGCSEMPRGEIAWQSVHALDVLQTVQIAKNPHCFHEDDPFSKRLIGEHPSQGQVVAWGVAFAAVHMSVGAALEHWEAPGWVQVGWQYLTLGAASRAVINNYQQGIGVFNSDSCL